MATNVATTLDIEGDSHIRPVTWDEWITLPVREGDQAVVWRSGYWAGMGRGGASFFMLPIGLSAHSKSMRPQSSGRPCTPERGAQAMRDLLMFSPSAASRLSPS